MLIGNLTRDPNLRYTPSGAAVCSFGLATNRAWTPTDGEKQERVDFHNIVAWAKLAEICGQILHKGDKVYVEGRIQTRDWKTEDGSDRRITEIVIDNMMLLARPKGGAPTEGDDVADVADEAVAASAETPVEEAVTPNKEDKQEKNSEDVSDDIPF